MNCEELGFSGTLWVQMEWSSRGRGQPGGLPQLLSLPSSSTGCRAGEEPVKISNLYPEDTNAMQISFAVPRAGWDGTGGRSEPPVAAGAPGGDSRAAI